ncbi:MAG: LacI family DNA-binding transcriptional regulator [Lachnospiraceae bacterium]|nr:LacI family DNA-binding transcriptional regulator [Lachnospiraceae bacterium]
MSSMKDVADMAHVSQATVSRVLSGHPSVKPDTKKRVLQCIKKLNYQPNIAARKLAGGNTGLIGIILPEISNPFYGEILHAIEEQADFEGYSIIVCCTDRDLNREKNILNKLQALKVDGIITMPVSTENSRQAYQKLDIPIIVATKQMEGFSSVSVSHYSAGKRIARYLLELGYERIGYVGSTAPDSASIMKLKGFQDYLNNAGFEMTDLIGSRSSASVTTSSMQKLVSKYLQKNGLHSDALFACDDVTACETIHALIQAGYQVPDDVAVVGFDNSLLARKMTPSVSSLAQPLGEIGRRAVDMLVRRINHETDEIELLELRTRIITRDSSSAFRKLEGNDR